MGRIEHITVCNFKSYGGTQVIGPFSGFTAVIGPNGSGKSNVMDAVSFVLGVQSSQLRGSSLADLLHVPGKSGERPTTGYVELCFRDDDGRERLFKRSITQHSGDYYADSRRVSQKRYIDALETIGVYVHSRNFLVFQGDVESIAQKSPEELVDLFDVLSGSSALKDDFQRLEEEARLRETEYIRAFERKKNTGKERREFQEQKNEAERYNELTEEKAKLLSQHFLWRMQMYDNECMTLHESVEEKRAAIDTKRDELDHMTVEKSEKAKQLGQARLDLTATSRKLSKLKHGLDRERSGVAGTTESQHRLQEAIAKEEVRLVELEKQREENNVAVQTLESQIAETKASLHDIDEEIVDANAVEQQLSIDEEQVERLRATCREQSADLQQQRSRLEHQHRAKLQFLSELKAQHEALGKEMESLRTPIEKLHHRLALLREEEPATAQRVDLLQEDVSRFRREQMNADAQRLELNQRLQGIMKKLQGAKADIQLNASESRMRESLAHLRRIYPSVHGRISDLCQPVQEKYHVALSVALGKQMNAVVVDDEKTAMECIQYMKEQRVGTCTFLPLSSLQAASVPDSLRQLGPSVKPLADTVLYDKTFERAVHYVCGNTLVCPSLAMAKTIVYTKRLPQRPKVVTLDGSVVHANGNMSGGSSGSASKSNRWNESEVLRLKDSRDELLSTLATVHDTAYYTDRINAKLDQLAEEEEALRFLRRDMRAAEEEQTRWKENLGQAETDAAALNHKINVAVKELDSCVSQKDTVEQEISDVEDAVFGALKDRIDVYRAEQDTVHQVQASAEKRIELQVALARLEEEWKRVSLRDTESKAQAVENKIETLRRRLQETSAKAQAQSSLLGTLVTRQESLESRIESKEESIVQLQSELESLQVAHLQTSNELSALDNTLADLESCLQSTVSERRETLQRARLDQIPEAFEVYDRDASFASSFADGSKQSLDAMYHSMDKEEAAAHFESAIEAVTAACDAISPNLKAIDKYDEVSEKFKETAHDFDGAKRESREAQQRFQACFEQRKKLFMESFGHVSKCIDDVYKNMTRSEKYPLGGTAYLYLENPEKPFESGIKFHAMPPSKRFRDMDQLSGGEKTVAALALLFAVHSFRPSPFFILDEIDAALDNVNVQKVGSYIQRRAREQQIQFLVISLKDGFFDKADSLVGVYKDTKKTRSGILTYDLSQHDDAHGLS